MPEATAAAPAEPVTQSPAAPPAEPAAPAAGAAPAEPTGEEGGSTPAPGTGLPKKGRMVPQERVDQITREKWDERRAREKAEAEAADLREKLKKHEAPPAVPAVAPAAGTPATPAPTAAAPAAPATPAAGGEGMEKLIEAAADRRLAAQEFNKKCNDAFDAGKKEFQEFEESMKNFGVFGGLSKFPVFTEAVVNQEGGHKVLNHLGQNLEEAERILSLPPVSQAIEVTRLAAKLTATAGPKISGAPAPVAPIKGATPTGIPQPDEDGDFQSQEDFRKFREASRKKK